MKINSKEFKELNNLWKSKLKESGFEDIEKPNGDLKRPSHQLFHKNRNNSNRYDYYRLLEQYRLNGHRQFRKFSQFQRACFNLHTAGLSLREISDVLGSKTGRYKSLGFTPSYVTVKRAIDPVVEACMAWHRSSPVGSLNPANQDMIVEEVLIAEREAYYDTSHYDYSERGLPKTHS